MVDVRKLVNVKPLEWKETQHCWEASTPVGLYSCGFDDGWWAQLEGTTHWNWETPEDPRCYLGPSAAMLACASDYEARILAALTPASDGLAEGLREAAVWREAATIARDHGFTNAQWRAGGENVRGALFHLFMARAAELEKADE